MNVFELRSRLITDYSAYIRSFIQIADERIREYVLQNLDEGVLWPESLIQLNPSFEPGELIDDLVAKNPHGAMTSNRHLTSPSCKPSVASFVRGALVNNSHGKRSPCAHASAFRVSPALSAAYVPHASGKFSASPRLSGCIRPI